MAAEVVLDRILAAPSVDRVRAIFEAAPDLDGGATPAEVDRAFAFVQGMYGGHYADAGCR